MKGVNNCTFIGNLGRDPEMRSTGGGTIVANCSIGVNDREKVGGEWKPVTEWVNLVAFGKTAEVLRDYARKGVKLYVSGKLKTRSWEKDGARQYRTEVIVNDLVLLSGRDDASAPAKPAAAAPQNAKEYCDQWDQNAITDEDIPF